MVWLITHVIVYDISQKYTVNSDPTKYTCKYVNNSRSSEKELKAVGKLCCECFANTNVLGWWYLQLGVGHKKIGI